SAERIEAPIEGGDADERRFSRLYGRQLPRAIVRHQLRSRHECEFTGHCKDLPVPWENRPWHGPPALSRLSLPLGAVTRGCGRQQPLATVTPRNHDSLSCHLT